MISARGEAQRCGQPQGQYQIGIGQKRFFPHPGKGKAGENMPVGKCDLGLLHTGMGLGVLSLQFLQKSFAEGQRLRLLAEKGQQVLLRVS